MPASIRMSMMMSSAARPGASCRVHMSSVFNRGGYVIRRGQAKTIGNYQANQAAPRKIGG